MSAVTYSQLALNWKPESKNNKQFLLITLIIVVTMMLLGIGVSWVKVPEQKRQARVDVPERIANFILDKEKPKLIPKVKTKPKPKPKPVIKPKPKPKEKEKAKVTKKIKKEPKKALTKTQQKAREKASKSGLLALGNVLADLMDTDDVSAMVGGSLKSASKSATKSTNNNTALLLADASKGSAGVDIKEYATTSTTGTSVSSLSQREITQVKQALLSPKTMAKAQNSTDAKNNKNKARERDKPRTAGIRAEEGITVVFDQNKSKLYSIYNRARRKNPGLRGKIVLEITVAPSGKVTKIKVVSNELNDAKLESRLVSRIKQFNFGAQHVEEITVTYPIEFLPA